jgi:hypothetical protein
LCSYFVGEQNELLRLYNQTPRQKEGKLEYIRKRRALQASTLNQGSIAMEVPTYTSDVVHPTAIVSEPDSSLDTTCEWVIPEYPSTPFMPASTQTKDVGSPDMSTEPLRRKHYMLCGQSAIVATNGSANMVEQGSGLEQSQSNPRFISNGNC